MHTALENTLLSLYKEGMIEYLHGHPEDFDEAIRLALGDRQPLSWRAAWVLWSCMDDNDERLGPFLKDIIQGLPSKKDGHQRELLKILSRMDVPEEYEAQLFDRCVSIWEGIQKRPSIRYTAYCTMLRIMHKYPELSHEIDYYSQNYYLESLSPGIKHAIRLMIEKRANSTDFCK